MGLLANFGPNFGRNFGRTRIQSRSPRMQPAALLAAFVLLVALPATGAQDPQAYFDSRLNFPTDFGQPSCIQWDANSRSLYLVGSTSVRCQVSGAIAVSHPFL